jgi:nucleoid-associated protein YgaU
MEEKTQGPPAAGAGDNQYTQWHEVVSGDTLWKIAKKYYGDGSLYMEIFNANKDVLTDPDKIKVGQKLRIP